MTFLKEQQEWENDIDYFFKNRLFAPDLKKYISNLLQNTRKDFLRSEIEKLEREIRIADEIPDTLSDIWQQAHNKALTSIITRYKEELKVLESK